MSVSSEGLESFGGQDTLRRQVLTIWEGTTNILSLDVLRCISKSNGQVLLSFYNDVEKKISAVPSELAQVAERLRKSLQSVLKFVRDNQGNPDLLSFAARDLAYSLSRIYIGALMIDDAAYSRFPCDYYATKRWCEQQLSLVSNSEKYSKQSSQMDKELVYGEQSTK